MSDIAEFYDQLASDYHLVYADWQAALRRQGEALDQLTRRALGEGSWSLLDCTAGIGTQALGLALRGYAVTASDISGAALERAAAEAKRLGVPLTTQVADVRELDAAVQGSFDVVVSCDNSLPHLLSADDVRLAVRQMAAKLRPGGLAIVGIRDYDQLLTERPGATMPQSRDVDGRRWVYFQVWDWSPDGQRYTLHFLLLREADGAWETRHASTEYRPLRRAELSAALQAAGLVDIQWHQPEETGHHQPLVSARRP